MGTENEYRILEGYCVGRGLNLCCQHTQIGDSIGVDADPNARAADVICDVRALPFRTGSLDYVLCHHGLEHIRDAPLFVVHEWLRVLRLGGVLVLAVPTGETALNYASFRGEAVQYGHGHLFTKETLKQIVDFAGGDVVRCELLERDIAGSSILLVARKSADHKPCLMPFSKPIEGLRMLQKNGVWKCSKRLMGKLTGRLSGWLRSRRSGRRTFSGCVSRLICRLNIRFNNWFWGYLD